LSFFLNLDDFGLTLGSVKIILNPLYCDKIQSMQDFCV